MTDLISIKKLHAELYGRYLNQPEEVAAEDPKVFEDAVTGLLDQMQEVSTDVTSLEDYEWLQGATEKWRAVFALAWGIPKEISLPPPRRPLTSSLSKQAGMVWSEVALRRWIQTQAFDAAKRRALRRFQALTAEEMLSRLPSTEDEMNQDWLAANLELAYEVFEGSIALAQLRSESYPRLEQCWLEDIKRVKAYHVWLDGGDGWHPELTDRHYFEGCRRIDARLKQRGKEVREFTATRDYLENRYLIYGEVDPAKSEPLIRAKAQRLFVATGNADAKQNWDIASDYVKTFYGSITSAISAGDLDAHDRVTKALHAEDERRLIINAFEMVIALNFLRTKEEIEDEQNSRSVAA